MPAAAVTHLKKYFGKAKAVEDVSFEVRSGEIFGLLGPNGAGKTTTIRIMLDIFKPDAGSVEILGQPMNRSLLDRIGYLPEDRGLYKDLKLEPTLVFLARLKGLSEADARARLPQWLERMDLYEHRDKKVEALSKGMQQKAQIIATLLHEPDLVVVDEPFTGLDPVNTRLVKDIIGEQRDAGKTVIMSTHQMYQVEALCSRIALIDDGLTVLYGRVDDIKRSFAGNAVAVRGEGNFLDIPGVIEVRQESGSWRMSLAQDTDPQGVLRELVRRPDTKIERFELAEPSLDDIFVTVVRDGVTAPAADTSTTSATHTMPPLTGSGV